MHAFVCVCVCVFVWTKFTCILYFAEKIIIFLFSYERPESLTALVVKKK
jgi:hypothetical protein